MGGRSSRYGTGREVRREMSRVGRAEGIVVVVGVGGDTSNGDAAFRARKSDPSLVWELDPVLAWESPLALV